MKSNLKKRLERIAFEIGDNVSFLSDRQTDKGPSDGYISKMDNENLYINHSDAEDDKFKISDLEISSQKGASKYKKKVHNFT